MNRFKIVVAVAVVVGVTTLWLVQHQTQVCLRAEKESALRQLERITQLEMDNEQLSNIVAQADGSRSNQQLMELLRLRSEVGILRQQTNEMQELRNRNAWFQAAAKAGDGARDSSITNLPPVAQPLAVYPKASWAFAGYSTPEDAFQSANWAASNGDINTLLASFTPDMQKEFTKQFENKSESEMSAYIKDHINKNSEISVLTKKVISDNFIALDVLGDKEQAGENVSPGKMVFQKIDGQWKLAADH